MTTPSVLIIGSGIIGASVAYAATQRKLPKRVLTSLPVNSVSSTTVNSWAWINANTDNDKSYFYLRNASMQLWRSWMRMIPDLKATSIGGFVWDKNPDELRAFAKCHREWGYPVELLSADAVAVKLPYLREVPDLAIYVPTEMAVEPCDTVSALLAAAKVKPEQRYVQSLLIEGDRVYGVMTDDGPCTADEVILASGNGTPALLKSVGVSLEMTPNTGLLVKTQPLPKLLSQLLTAPDYHVRQTATEQLLIGSAFSYHQALKEDQCQQFAAELVARVERALHCPLPLEVASFSLGRRVIPKGGRPQIGRVKKLDGTEILGLYIAVMHSGISNAAAVADQGVAELATNMPSPLLAPFRPHAGIDQAADGIRQKAG